MSVAGGPSWTSAFSVPVKTKRPLGVVPALSKPRFWRTPRVPAATGRNGDGTGSDASWRPSRPNSRTHGSISRVAKPSDVITSVPSLVSVRPSGSTLSGANGWPVASRKRRHGDDLDRGSAAGTSIRSV